MPQPLPDRFDDIEKSRRVGVHRAPKRKGSGLIRALWLALAIALVSMVGILLLVIGPEKVLFPQGSIGQDAESTTEAEVRGKIDAATTITVLNGTPTPELGQEVADLITQKQYGTVTYVGAASESTAKISAVFYHDPADEALAKGLGEKLGGMQHYLREDYVSYGTQLIVLLGSDYEG